MAKRQSNNYFSMLEEMATCSYHAAEELETILSNFSIDELDQNITKLHAIEHRGDGLKHDLVSKLVREFITPIEREDIMAIANEIDDVTDAVEDVLLRVYMYNLQSVLPDAIVFAGIAKQCCNELLSVLKDFTDFKKSKTIHNSIIELNHLEETGDNCYINSVRNLYISDVDAKSAAAWTEIYRCLEKVCDTCEHAADLVENVIMKNT